jgi:peptidoglycan/xylan/chitin deacetylase (PgdA/CDA1 family)
MRSTLFTRSAVRARGKLVWAGVLRVTGVLALAKHWVRRHGTVVLTFHRVLRDDDLQKTGSLPGMVVRQQTFDDFLRYAAQQYEWADILHEPDRNPGARLRLALTFDDGWSDNASIAFPLASRLRVPMVIFIVSEKLGSASPFWPERAVTLLGNSPAASGRGYIEQEIETLKGMPAAERKERVGQLVAEYSDRESTPAVDTTMTWEQVRELDRQGVRFGSHTSTHEILTAIPLIQAEEEIVSSRQRIERELAKDCRLFSYPNGDFSRPVRDTVQRAGYKFAFLNQDPGVWTRDCDPYLVPRVNVCEYHLVGAHGRFSPLIFDYAVLWNAAKGLMKERWQRFFSKLRGQRQNWSDGAAFNRQNPAAKSNNKKELPS